MMAKRKRRVAIIGGKGPLPTGVDLTGAKVKMYRSPADGSWNDLRRLVASIKRGTLDEVIVWTRFNSHVVSKTLARVCKNHKTTCTLYAGG